MSRSRREWQSCRLHRLMGALQFVRSMGAAVAQPVEGEPLRLAEEETAPANGQWTPKKPAGQERSLRQLPAIRSVVDGSQFERIASRPVVLPRAVAALFREPGRAESRSPEEIEAHEAQEATLLERVRRPSPAERSLEQRGFERAVRTVSRLRLM